MRLFRRNKLKVITDKQRKDLEDMKQFHKLKAQNCELILEYIHNATIESHWIEHLIGVLETKRVMHTREF